MGLTEVWRGNWEGRRGIIAVVEAEAVGFNSVAKLRSLPNQD